jgi:ribosomal protein L35AE/L33A
MALHMMEQFKEPRHEIIEIRREASDETATSVIREVFQRMALGEVKKKVILKVEGTSGTVSH